MITFQIVICTILLQNLVIRLNKNYHFETCIMVVARILCIKVEKKVVPLNEKQSLAQEYTISLGTREKIKFISGDEFNVVFWLLNG